MPIYTYQAKSSPHQNIQGNIEAESEQEAIRKLAKMGVFPIYINSEIHSLNKQRKWYFGNIPRKDLVLFTVQLSSLIDSGINIIDSLNIAQKQISNKYLKSILMDISEKIRDGMTLSDSLAMHPYLFPDLYSSIIRAGEASGSLPDSLKSLSGFLEKEEEFKNSLYSNLTYPFFVFLIGVLTILTLLIFVIPRLVVMFEDMGQMLPLPTKILIDFSRFLQSSWWGIIAVCFLSFFLLRRAYRTSGGKIFFDKIKLFVFGPIVLKTEIGRLMRTMALLLSKGVPITFALDVSISVLSNEILKSEVQKCKKGIAQGLSFSNAFKNSVFFSGFVINILSVGEESGTFEKSLTRIAEEYEKDVDRFLKIVTKMTEPVVILIIGLVVGFIVLSMLLPIFRINMLVG